MIARIIARLDIKGPNLVKGIHLEGLRVLGKPEHFALHYYESGADELLYQDVVASLYGRNSLVDIITETAKQIFIPLTVGGGLRTVDDIRMVLRAGADKVALNTAAIVDPDLVREAARRFGSSTIVVSIEAKKRPDGSYEAYTNNGRERTRLEVQDWAVRAAELGAGEILLTSIDQDGTGAGFDLDLIRAVGDSVPIPVIASGGAGHSDHVAEAILTGHADAVAVASILHYHYVKTHPVQGDYSGEGNIQHLLGGGGFARVQDISLPAMKAELFERGIECRRAA
ncbi:MAG TPA: imidazole glycerol phosphate synthase cyclase subunit [Gaiellaceae bacterium]|nr:imidazole glycerol phosphate synthase cyclase subunit [Gaiellaceae bacterium]